MSGEEEEQRKLKEGRYGVCERDRNWKGADRRALFEPVLQSRGVPHEHRE